MQITNLEIEGLKLITQKIYHDNRGFFNEKYVEQKFHDLGITNKFVQDNHSFSHKGVIRGLHYQANPSQAKLVSCIRGKILDVAVDIRKNSKTYGKYFSVELTAENGLMLYIPAGFAHGFAALTDCDVLYKVDGGYNPRGEGGIIYNDKTLNIDWKVTNEIVSEKDLSLPNFLDYQRNPVF
ncbi:MAG: dTDP-4-dehydrorhamnose 3,5-epimerase [Rickettsiales bacterium]|nr:dTDP-4-dehydrorhamnose 3,5-epimerase [Rickettsiales bacterium]